MISATVAKFVCHGIDKYGQTEVVKLSAVMGRRAEDSEEDKSFYAASPNGEMKLHVDNPAVHGFFEPGKSYYITIEPA